MNSAQKLNAVIKIRFIAVAVTGMLGLYTTAIVCGTLLRQAVADASTTSA